MFSVQYLENYLSHSFHISHADWSWQEHDLYLGSQKCFLLYGFPFLSWELFIKEQWYFISWLVLVRTCPFWIWIYWVKCQVHKGPLWKTLTCFPLIIMGYFITDVSYFTCWLILMETWPLDIELIRARSRSEGSLLKKVSPYYLENSLSHNFHISHANLS